MTRNLILTAAIVVCGAESIAGAQVTVSGGRDKVQMNTYVWTVANQGSKSITRFEFPRYRVQFFTPPKDWSAEIVKEGPDGKALDPQRVVYKTEVESAAIRPGQSAVFSALITMDKATPGRQEVTIGFADGTTLEVSGVEIPWDVSWLEKNALLLGMGAIFVIFLLIQLLRGRRRALATQIPPT